MDKAIVVSAINGVMNVISNEKRTLANSSIFPGVTLDNEMNDFSIMIITPAGW